MEHVEVLADIQVLGDFVKELQYFDLIVEYRTLQLRAHRLHRDRLEQLGSNNGVAHVIATMNRRLVIALIGEVKHVVCNERRRLQQMNRSGDSSCLLEISFTCIERILQYERILRCGLVAQRVLQQLSKISIARTNMLCHQLSRYPVRLSKDPVKAVNEFFLSGIAVGLGQGFPFGLQYSLC